MVFSKWNDLDFASTCAMQNKPGENNIALIGSSHAAHLFYGLSKLSYQDNNSIALFSMGAQSPFIKLKTNDEQTKYWYKRIVDAYDYIENHNNIKIVILADLAYNHFIDIENPLENDFRILPKIFSKTPKILFKIK